MMKFLKGCSVIAGGFFLLVIVTSVLFGSNANKSGTNETNATGNAAYVQSQESIPVGTLVDIKSDRAVQIERSENVNSIAGNEFMKSVEAKGGKLVVVYMTLKNTGQESGNMFWSSFQLVDDQGRKYDEVQDFEEIVTIGAWLETQGLEDTSNQLFPGATAKTAKVFRVAPDASGLKMITDGRTFSIN
jgi:hypothetical protein